MLQERRSPPFQKDLHRLLWVMEVPFAHMLLALSSAPAAISCPVRELPGRAHREQDTRASTGGLRGGCPPSPLPRKQVGQNNALRVVSGLCCPCQPYYLSPWANSSCSGAHGQVVIMGTRGRGEPSSCSLPPVPGAHEPDVRAGISATGGPAATEPSRLPSQGRKAPAQVHGYAAHHSLKASK